MRNKVPVVLAPRWTKNDLWKKAKAVPSLDLRFADSKSLVDATTGQNLVTFTRASEGTFVNSQGQLQTAANNAPRFDHNPTTGESLGLLVEEQRTNLLLRSEEFDNAAWTLTGIAAFGSGSVANTTATVAPNGTLTADKIVETSGGTTHLASNQVTITTSTVYTLSVYAKAAERSRVALYFGGAGGAAQGIIVNLTNGTFAANIVAAPTSYSITPFGNGWYRISITATSTGTAATHAVYICNDSNAFSYSGDGTSGIYVWGAQLEAGAFPTSYIKTDAAAATRSADVCSISGSNFSSWYRQDQGAVFVDALRNPTIGAIACRHVIATDGTANNRIYDLRQDTASFMTAITAVGGNLEAAGSLALNSSTGRNRVAMAQALNSYGATANGGAIAEDLSVTNPTVNRLEIGSFLGTSFINGHLRRLTYWPQRLGNEVLQRITQ